MSSNLKNTLNTLNGLLGTLGESVPSPIDRRRYLRAPRGHAHRKTRVRKEARSDKSHSYSRKRGRHINGRDDHVNARSNRKRNTGQKPSRGGDIADAFNDFDSFMNAMGEDGEEGEGIDPKGSTPCMLPAYEKEYELEMHDMEHDFDEDDSSPCIFCKYGDELGRSSMNKIQETHSRIMEILRSNMGNANKDELFRQAQEAWKDRISSVFKDKGIPMEEWKITDLRRHFGSITNPKMHYIDPELITSEMIRLTHAVIIQFIHELMLKDGTGQVRVNKEANAQLGRTVRNLIWLMMKLEYFRGIRRRENEKNTRNTPPGEDFFSGGGFENKFVAIPREISDVHRSTFYDDFDD